MFKKYWERRQHKAQKLIEQIDSFIEKIDFTDHSTLHERLFLSEKQNKALKERNFYRSKLGRLKAKEKYDL